LIDSPHSEQLRQGFDEVLHRRFGRPDQSMRIWRNDNDHETARRTDTSHPGRPGLDELVPSRYALRVGEIDVLVISDGVVTPPAESMATNADDRLLSEVASIAEV
jgi:hypothetical protein